MNARLTFGEWLEDLLIRRGITQSEFAELVGVAQTTVSGWVNGQRPRRRVVPAIARVLEVDQGEVMRRAGWVSDDGITYARPSDEVAARVAEQLELFDPSDPLISAALANQDKLTPRQKRIAARLIEALVEEAQDAGLDVE